jgi:protein-L-isoaspartate(D-aspartate) O-methyltransferase
VSARSVAEHRAFYARLVVRMGGSADERLIAAFDSVEREHFVGPGPWSVFVDGGYVVTPSDDPIFLYQDVVVGLATERHINNGQPSLHARCLAAAAVSAGCRAIHVGAGSGYYTAMLANLVGDAGAVTAYEIEPDLAERARGNLCALANVEVVGKSATEGALPSADLIYVNAGATHPPAGWLDALNVGGRLVFPLTPNEGFGVMLLVTRRAADVYAADVIAPVQFIPCIGARDDAMSQAIMAALRARVIMTTRSLRRGVAPDDTVTVAGDGWWLSSAEPVA